MRMIYNASEALIIDGFLYKAADSDLLTERQHQKLLDYLEELENTEEEEDVDLLNNDKQEELQ